MQLEANCLSLAPLPRLIHFLGHCGVRTILTRVRHELLKNIHQVKSLPRPTCVQDWWDYFIGVKDQVGAPFGSSPTYVSNGQPMPPEFPVVASPYSGQCYAANPKNRVLVSGAPCDWNWNMLCVVWMKNLEIKNMPVLFFLLVGRLRLFFKKLIWHNDISVCYVGYSPFYSLHVLI